MRPVPFFVARGILVIVIAVNVHTEKYIGRSADDHRRLTRTPHHEPAVPDSAAASLREWKPYGVSCPADIIPLCLWFVSEKNSNLGGNQDGVTVVQAANSGSA